MERLAQTLASVMSELSQRAAAGDECDPGTWIKKILTRKELRHIKVRYFKKGVMGITTDSSTWLYYFTLHRQELLERLRAFTGTVKEVRFYIGEVE